MSPGPASRPRRARLMLMVLILFSVAVTAVTGRIVLVLTGSPADDPGVTRSELAYLRSALNHGAAERMQELFPEGFFFTNVLYGLALTDLAEAGHLDRERARLEADQVLRRLASPAGTAVFDRDLSPRYGVFYAGWALMLRAQAASLASPLSPAGPRRSEALPAQERMDLVVSAGRLADAVRTALDHGGSPFLTSYPGRSWPVDTVVAIAALSRSDRVTGADHRALISRWVERAKVFLDPATGLLPHETGPTTGRGLTGARGSSQSIIQRFWPLVDPDGAADAYRRFRSAFLTRQFGVVGIREYPRGVSGGGDVDSGPLIAGMSASATAVAIGAARVHGDSSVATALTDEADVFGLPVRWGGTRRYLGGALPISDAFLAWARVAPLRSSADSPPGGTRAPLPGAPTAWWPVPAMGGPWLAMILLWLVAARRGWVHLPASPRPSVRLAPPEQPEQKAPEPNPGPE